LSLALANTGSQGGGRRWLYPLWALLALFVLWGLVALLAVPVLGALVALAGWQMVQNNLGHLGLKRQKSVLAFFSVNRHQAVAWTMLLLAVFSSITVLWLVGIGVALTTALWVHQASGKLVFRQYSGLQRRSLELRSPANRRHLQQVGHRVQVLELEGDLFFGTALLLRERLEAAYPQHPYDGETHHLVLDFSRLDQIDASGMRALESLLQRLQQKCGITVWLSYVRHHPGLCQHLQRSTVGQWVPVARWVADTEAALEAIEDELLAAHHPEWQQSVLPQDVLKCPLAAEDWQTFAAACETVALTKGETLYAPGYSAEHVYWLVKGDVRLVLPPLPVPADVNSSNYTADPRRHRSKRLAVLNPGTWLGLDGLLPGGTRKATAVAHQPCELLRLDVNVLNGWATTHTALAACLFSNLAAEATERLEAVGGELVVVDA
jgi:CRP-like cAMP-binding protein/anti-anti-sigma regulatory factor